jgi:hypothetical protein
MKTYAICRNGRFLSYTKSVVPEMCWGRFLKKHLEIGGIYVYWEDFIEEAKELGFEVGEYK